MGKKKPFIDKKKASTYHLLYRSQRDVADEDGDGPASGVVLWPNPDNNKETDQKVLVNNSTGTDPEGATMKQWQQELSKAGLVDDYDYDKHTKPITGTGVFFDVERSRHANAMADPRSRTVEDELVNEVDRQLDSIALTAECMDDDIAEALFGDFDAGDYEELNDEFVLDAAKESEDTGGDQAFNFADHVQSLIEKARMESDGTRNLTTIHEQGREDQAFFAKSKALGHDEEEDEFAHLDENDWQIEGTPGVVPKLSESEEKALCEKFEEALAEYDSDDIGEGVDDDDVIGDRPLEGDKQIESALDEFLQEKQDEIFMAGSRHYLEQDSSKGGSGFAALVGKKMVLAKELEDSADVQGEIRPIQDVLGEADDILGSGNKAPPAEEVLIDGKSYYSEKMRNPWDCESILTTYSNMDNNPVTIGSGGRRRRKKKNPAEHSKSVEQIVLSDKTGLPLGVLPVKEEEDGIDTYMSVNKGEARSKNENKDDKKLRKQNVKKERQMARMQKKMMKEAFSEEFSKRTQEVLVDDVGGKSVFRF